MNVAFIHGRPSPHPFHEALARSVGAELMVVDPILRWNGLEVSPLRRYMSWLLCGLSFPKRNSYDLFMTEGGHATPIVMRMLGLLNDRQRTAALMANETFYFMKVGRYPQPTIDKLLWMFKRFDALLCMGSMQTRLAKELITPVAPGVQILTIRSCVQKDRADAFSKVVPELGGKNIVCIANGPGGFRSWYKGIDLVFGAMEIALRTLPDLDLTIAGEWEDTERQKLKTQFPNAFAHSTWLGQVKDVSLVLKSASLSIQMGRGDAYPIAIMESQLAGVPVIASEWTGSSEAVAQVEKAMVVPLEPEVAAVQIIRYFRLSPDERAELSRKGREVAATYTEERAMCEFREAVDTVMNTPRKGRAG